MTQPNTPPSAGITWKRRPGGLYLPDSHNMPPPVVPPAAPPVREQHKVTDWLQGVGTAAAAIASAVALLISSYTLQDQQQINRDQMAFNKEARERTKRRYISRVTWWVERQGSDFQIHIENRSPARLKSVTAFVNPSWYTDNKVRPDRRIGAFMKDLPPCVSVSYLFDPPERPPELDPARGVLSMDRPLWGATSVKNPPAAWTLRVADYFGYWDLPLDGPIRLAIVQGPDVTVPALLPKGNPISQREISDCGEGD